MRGTRMVASTARAVDLTGADLTGAVLKVAHIIVGGSTGFLDHEDRGIDLTGASAELAAILNAEAFDYLAAPVLRIGAAAVPIPFSPPLELRTIPNVEQIVETELSQRR